MYLVANTSTMVTPEALSACFNGSTTHETAFCLLGVVNFKYTCLWILLVIADGTAAGGAKRSMLFCCPTDNGLT